MTLLKYPPKLPRPSRVPALTPDTYAAGLKGKTNVYIVNFAPCVTSADLYDLLSVHGPIKDLSVLATNDEFNR